MDTQGTKNAQWGFKDMEPGWYMMKVLEGIEEISSDDGSRKSFRIPLAVDEGEFAGSQQSIFVQTNADKDKIIAFNKKKVADLLENTGLYAEFEKKFPGDVDILSAPVLKGLTLKLPGKFLMVRVDEVKGKKDPKTGERETFINIVELAPSNFKPTTGSGKASGKAAEKAKAAVAPEGTSSNDESWD